MSSKEEIIEMLELENTRVLYNGIQRLREQFKGEITRESIAEKVEEIYKECRTADKLLVQNPMSDFFNFLGYGDTKVMNEEEKNRLAGMLLLYDKVETMEESPEKISAEKTYIKDYNEICNYISMIAGDKTCYLVHARDSGNTILARAVKEYDEEREKRINSIQKAGIGESTALNDTTSVFAENRGLIIKLLVSRRKDVTYKQSVYIIIFNGEEFGVKKRNEIVRSILFLRQQLQHLLERDLYAIHHFKMSYEDVRSINGNDKIVRILHVTDLHVNEKNADSIIKTIEYTNFGNKILSLEEQLKFDLIVITGDVAQGSDAASNMEANYNEAARVIRALAKKLWSNGEGLESIQFDWQKRVIIIPGNHDYASMNELMAVHRNRATFIGEPAKEEGSPMAKYTYYIDFLRKLLDMDITDIVNKNLNDYRIYSKMGVRFVCLNTVSEVSVLRNNKMQIDEHFASQITDKETGKEFVNIYLMHHTPLYKNDYNRDKYMTKDTPPIMMRLLESIIMTLNENSSDDDKIKKTIDLKDIQGRLDDLKKDTKGTALYTDIVYLQKHWFEPTNERCREIIAEFNNNDEMSEKDYVEYKRRLKLYTDKIPADFVLGGHTHRRARDKDNKYYEGGLFYPTRVGSEGAYLNYGVLELDRSNPLEGPKGTYSFYPPEEECGEQLSIETYNK